MKATHRFSVVIATLFILSLLIGGMFASRPTSGQAAPDQQAPAPVIARGVSTAAHFDISPNLRDIPPQSFSSGDVTDLPERESGLEGALGTQDIDLAVQAAVGSGDMPVPIISFDGPSNLAGVSPPDPVGDVGPNHYVAMSNLYFAVYDKSGTLLYGPAANNTLWAGFEGACEVENSGDPIVVYDQLADRWMLTQFTSLGPIYYNCVALSTSGDPTGSYYRWAFSTGTNFPDYPKYGIWPDAYYISTREFGGGGGFVGMGAYALNRDEMLIGEPTPQVISFLATPGSTPYNLGDGLLPTDIDGSTLPPPGSPNYFMGSMDNGGPYGAPQDALTLWKFHVDWAVPGNSTFALASTIPVAAFDSIFPCSPGSRNCIPQPATSNKIDILSYRQRPMWRLAYRNFGTHESLVTNQSVEASTAMAGIRWYEIRDPNGTPTIYQQGTYAPGASDGIHRWMGSIAMDVNGNMALGYSASDGVSTYPSSWYTGRLVSDTLGTLPQGEESIIDGTGSQTTSARWGDYTSMNIDPVDDCTFWYVNEYLPVTSGAGWRLRIGAFKFPSCQDNPEADVSIAKTIAPTGILSPGQAITYTLSVLNQGPDAVKPVIGITNTNVITIPDVGTGLLYPSEIIVPALDGVVVKATVTVLGLTHTFPDNVDLLLAAPGGQSVLLMSDAGGDYDLLGVNFTFDDAAALPLPDNALIPSGSYQPTNYDVDTDTFPAPAPAAPYTTTLSVFDGLSPAGSWNLYLVDDLSGDDGSLTAWSLTLVMAHSVRVTDDLPAGTTATDISAPGWNCDQAGQMMTCLYTTTLAVGPAPEIVVSATAPVTPGVIFTNTAWVSSVIPDPDLDNNVSQAISVVNTPPQPVDDGFSAVEDSLLVVAAPGVLSNDLDVDAQALNAAIETPPGIGVLSLSADGGFVYTPTVNFNGEVSFTYRVSDGIASATATTLITVSSINDDPVVDAGDDQSADEGDLVAFSGSFIDPGLRAALAAGESILWDFGDGTNAADVLTPTHTYGDNGVFTVTLVITDADGGTGVDSLWLTVANAAPELEAFANLEVSEGEPFTITGMLSDAGLLDTFEVAIAWETGVTETLALPAGATSFDAAYAFAASGDYLVSVTLSDDDGDSVTQTFMVSVSSAVRKVYLPLIAR